MYKLLIVDDEEIIRMGIFHTIPWTDLAISQVKTAANGGEGLALFKQFHPDIILTDIRMPVMDGLELLDRVVQAGTGVKVIILSGYEDFGYARSALKLGAFDYLLKTADIAELTGVLHKAVVAIEKDRQKERQLDKSLLLLRNRYLTELLLKRERSKEIYHELNLAGTTLADFLIVAVAEMDQITLFNEEFSGEQSRLLRSRVLEIAGAELDNQETCFESHSEELVWIYHCDPDVSEIENRGRFITQCQSVSKRVACSLDVSLRIGLSNVGSGEARVSLCYEQAKTALEYTLFTGKSSFVLFEEIADKTGVNFQIAADDEHRLFSALRVADKQLVLDTLHKIFEQIRECRNIRVTQFQQICGDLISSAFRVLHEFNINPADLFGKEVRFHEEIKKQRDFTEARQWVVAIFEKMAVYILHNKILKNKRVIEQAKQFIAEHYHEDLTLNKIAETVFMSPNYFSNLFSNEVGESFLEYLTSLRLQKAKQLLGEKDAKAFEVGEKVGYDNPQYFSKIFKKYTGMTPSEYREYLQKNSPVNS